MSILLNNQTGKKWFNLLMLECLFITIIHQQDLKKRGLIISIG